MVQISQRHRFGPPVSLLAAALACAVAVGTVVLGAAAPTAAAARKSGAREFWFVFVSDSHLGSPQGNRWAEAIPADIRAYGLAEGSQPAVVIHGGDMTEFGTREQYERFRDTFAVIGRPVHGVPGNHESKWADAGKDGFRDIVGRAFTSFDHQGVHFVLLDTSVDGETYGHLERYMLDWLEQDLKKSAGMPSIVFAHHPIGYGVTRFIDNDDDFFETIAPYDVRAVFTGHGHSTLRWTVNGVPCFMAPAAMDGRYMVVEVDDEFADVSWKEVGSDPVPFATVPLRTSAAPAAEARVGATVEGDDLLVTASLEGAAFAPSAAKYRVDLGPWKDLKQGDGAGGAAPAGSAAGASGARASAAYTAAEKVASMPEGVHVVHARFETARGEAWIARCEVVIGEDDRILWKYSADGGIQGTPAVSSGLLLFGTNDGTLTALRLADGRRAWAVRADGAVPGRVVVSGRYAYFGTTAGSVYCVDLNKGSVKWKRGIGGAVVGGVESAGGRVYACTMLGTACALDASTGRLLWESRLGGAVRAAPAAGARGLFAGAWDGKVYSLSTSKGEIRWTTTIDQSPYYSSANCRLLPAGGVVYASSPANPRAGGYGLTAIDEDTGEVLWRSTVGAGYSEPVMAGGDLVATDSAGRVHFIDPATGAVKRSVEGGGPCLGSSAVPGPDGSFLIGTTTGQVRVVPVGDDSAPSTGAVRPQDSPAALDATTTVTTTAAAPTVVVVQVGDGFIFARAAVSGRAAYVCTLSGDAYAVSLDGIRAASE